MRWRRSSPRRLKSLAVSVALPAWLLGNDPALGIVGVTYGRELSDKFTRDCWALMTAPWGWLADYLSELAAFPWGRRDDQVNSTA